jgi:PAS domain S-box-containing protein
MCPAVFLLAVSTIHAWAIVFLLILILAITFLGNMILSYNKLRYREIVTSLHNQEFLVNFTNLLNSFTPFRHKIDKALNIWGRYIGASHIQLFEDKGNYRFMQQTFEWRNKPDCEPKDQIRKIFHTTQVTHLKKLLIKDGILQRQDIQNITPQIDKYLTNSNIESILILPIFLQNNFLGFVILEYLKPQPVLNDMQAGFMKTISTILSNAFERDKYENEIKTSETKFREFFNLNFDPVFIFSSQGNILEVNEKACETFEKPKEEIIGQNIQHFFSNERFSPNWIVDDISKNEPHVYESEFTNNQGKIIPFEICEQTIQLSDQQAVMCIIRDISSRKHMEREILFTTIQTEEKERGRIAQDLHDGLGPLLSSLKMYTKVLGTTTSPERRAETLNTTNEVIDESITLIKEISNNLSPHLLNEFGLASAIQSFCKKISITKTIDIRFDSNVFDMRFDQNLEYVLFRILKELINNTIKHASASRVEIFLLRTEKTLSLVYSDNGTGFDLNKVQNSQTSGMGISNIVSRINSINGKLFFESLPEKGIQFKFEVGLN